MVEAVRQGTFHVYPVCTIDEGIPLLTGAPAGEAGPEGTVNFLVHRRLKELAEQAKSFRSDGEPAAGRSDDANSSRPSPRPPLPGVRPYNITNPERAATSNL